MLKTGLAGIEYDTFDERRKEKSKGGHSQGRSSRSQLGMEFLELKRKRSKRKSKVNTNKID